MKFVKVFGLLTLSIPLYIIGIHYYSSKPKQKRVEQVESKAEEEFEEDFKVSWAELDPNLLGEILSKLCLNDQARFVVVCKNWSAAHLIIKPILPWHGSFVPGSFVRGSCDVKIYDPLLSPNCLASRHTISCSRFGTAKMLCVHHKWLLICIKKTNWFSMCLSRTCLLFSPFTKTIITLPKLDSPRCFRFVSTFSTQPDSPDCVFCLVDAHNVGKIAIVTYRNGDKEWTATQFNTVPDFRSRQSLVVVLGGILYIVSPFGQVASYSILHGEFNFDYLFVDDLFLLNAFCPERIMKLFVLNGELMILYVNSNSKAKTNATLPGQQLVRRYDRSGKVWIPVSTLADYALFVNENMINVAVINTKDTSYNRVLPNKIYHFFNGGCLLYSLEEGYLVQFKSINSNSLEDGGGELPEYKYNYGIPDDALTSHWLEAPCIRSSSNNQEVHGFRDEGRQGTVSNRSS